MKIVTTFHQPSSVISSLKCQLSSRGLEHLVVAKLHRIDVYALQPDGLEHRCGLEIWGKVLSIRSVPIAVCLKYSSMTYSMSPTSLVYMLEFLAVQIDSHDRTPRSRTGIS